MKVLNVLKTILFVFLLLVGAAVSWACGILTIILLTPTLTVWFSVPLAILLAGLALYGIIKLLFSISKKMPLLHRAALTSSILTLILGAAVISVLWVPIDVPELEQKSAPYDTVSLSKGEEIALYHIEPKEKLYDTPILFIPGGPGGSVKSSVVDFLKGFADSGYDVYAYDHYSGGRSSLVDYDISLLTIDDEVRRLHELIDAIGAKKIYLIGHSYAGVVLGRFSAIYPEQAEKIVMLDTSPLYNLTGGNMKDQETYDPNLAEMLKAESAQEGGDVPASSLSLSPKLSLRENIRGLIMMGWTDSNQEPYIGKNDEWSFFAELLISSATQSDDSLERVFTGLSSIAERINSDLAKSEDYSEELIRAETAPVLVVHPDDGVVPWPIHKDYENFFDEVYFYPLENAGHSVWLKSENAEKLVQVIDAFFQGVAESDRFYAETTDPFAKN